MPRETIRFLYSLAARLGVGIGEACDRAGIARSSPPRWKRGTRPRPNQLALLRQAIIDLASERGTLVGHAEGIKAEDTVSRDSMMGVLTLARDLVMRIENSLGLRGDGK